ncbi:MAG: SH3 domain-containing protein [Bacteroidota bacterium]
MSRKKKSILPSIEITIVLVFFLSFVIWAVSKCNATQVLYQQQAETLLPQEESSEVIDENEASAIQDQNTLTSESDLTPATPPNPDLSTSSTSPAPTPSAPPTNLGGSSILYVTIDGLNMRTGPHLDSTVIRKLKLFEEVIFMNEVTDSTQQISLGTEMANEPWVKVKHQRGYVGWVYGAGVNYYKKKRSGVN